MSSSNEKPRPNFILILTDDQGWDDLGHHGNTYLETPVLDRFARDSVQFANFYVTPVCAPTRAALLTGRHHMRTGVTHVHGGKDFVHPDETMIGEIFQQAGYRTAMFGKWHSGRSAGYYPWERGFDEAYMARLYKHKDSLGHLNGEERSHKGWTVDTLTDYALDFLERHADQPFFLYLPYLTVHAPLAAPDDLVEKYQAKGLSKNLATVYAMVEQLDGNIGRLLSKLEELKLEENTVVLFLSDNGPAVNDALLTDEDRRIRYVNRYKGHKGNMWENGIKVPLFVRWPGHFKPRTVQRLTDVTDLMPTLLDLAGVPLPGGNLPLDGRSIAPYLEGDESSLTPRESYVYVSVGWPPDPSRPYTPEGVFDEYRPVAPEEKPQLDYGEQLLCIRTEEYKLLHNPGKVDGMPEIQDGHVLINMQEDPKEDRNLYSEQRSIGLGLGESLHAWFEQIKREPHSYHAPEIVVRHGDTPNMFGAYWPKRIRGGLKNAVHHLANWKQRGDGADYELVVEEGGRFDVRLDYEKRNDLPIRLRAKVGGSSVEADITDPDRQTLGTLEIAPGRHELSLDVVDAASSDNPAINRITSIVLRPV